MQLEILLTSCFKTLVYIINTIYFSWKSFETSLISKIDHLFRVMVKRNPLPLYKWIKVPNWLFWFIEKLEQKLFFEYREYTPFTFSTETRRSFRPTTPYRLARRKRYVFATEKKPYVKFDKNAPTTMTSATTKLTLLGTSTPVYVISNLIYDFLEDTLNLVTYYVLVKKSSYHALQLFRKTIGSGAFYLKGLFIVFFIDACLTDDEPLWEPIEWSLVQSWILFIFLFAWIAENLITSAYGSYTGRDKRVWFSWYKTFWLVEVWYAISLGLAALFVITPFYNELTYTTPFIVSWWSWYSRVFFCKFITLYSIILYISYFLQINIRFMHWKKLLYCTILINLFLSYLLYIHFFMSFFGYLTDPNWYLKNRLVDYIQLSHEPHRWGWGVTKPVKRDHFLQHRSTSLFWFKNDGPFASAFLFLHIYFFLCLFFLYIFWLTLMRRAIATQEFTYTFTVFCISGLQQFFYFFFLFYLLIIFSFILNYWRTPVENHWLLLTDSWVWTFTSLVMDLLNLF